MAFGYRYIGVWLVHNKENNLRFYSCLPNDKTMNYAYTEF